MRSSVLRTSFFFNGSAAHRDLPSSPPRRSPDLPAGGTAGPDQAALEEHRQVQGRAGLQLVQIHVRAVLPRPQRAGAPFRSEEHTSELQSQSNLVCRLLLEKKT